MRILILGLALLTFAPLYGAKVIVFGDSLSVETAFFYRFIEPGSTLWHEKIADELALERAYQLGGLFNPSGTNQSIAGEETSSLNTQLTRFRNNHNSTAGDLCLIWIGGNDIRNYTGSNLESDMAARTEKIGNLIRELATIDQVDRFLVPNLPDIGSIPESLSNPTAAAARTMITVAFNEALDAELDALRLELNGITIHELDIFKLFDQMLFYSLDYGYLNVTQPLTSASGSPDPSTYAFYDNIHPTARSHDLIASAALIVLDPNRAIELVSQSIEPDLSLRQTWLANPELTYQVLSGTELNNLTAAASYTDSPAHTVAIPPPGPARGFYQTRVAP